MKLSDKPTITMDFTIAPLDNIKYRISGLLGDFNAQFVTDYYPPAVGNRLNVVVSELVNNVVENNEGENNTLGLSITLNGQSLTTKVRNRIDADQYRKVKRHLSMIKKAKNKQQLLAETITTRREQGLQGGLGLIRLAFETDSVLSCRYISTTKTLIITSKINVRDMV